MQVYGEDIPVRKFSHILVRVTYKLRKKRY